MIISFSVEARSTGRGGGISEVGAVREDFFKILRFFGGRRFA